VNKESACTRRCRSDDRIGAYSLRVNREENFSMTSSRAAKISGADPSNVTTILVALGNALMAEGLCQLLQLHGHRCWAGESPAEPAVLVVDGATVREGHRYPKARILFIQMERDPGRIAALWHRVDAVIPPSSGLQSFEKTVKALSEERFQVRRARLCALQAEPPAPFTLTEKKVIDCICRGGTTKEIAQGVHLSPHTVKVHIRNILTKCGAPNRACLITLLTCCT
jgi:DNA-binding NarL/FixJ family response regulator